MAQQHINLGTAPAGSDGDTNRTAWTKTEANFNELYGRGLPVGRNLLINPQGRINQRVFAGGALAAGVYGYDRWKAGSGGCNITVNATTGIFTHTSGPLVQVIEAPRVAGLAVTFSVEDPSGTVGVNVDGVTGTITAGTGRRGVTLTVPSGSTGNVTLTITAAGVTYKNPQLEAGNAATAFDARPFGAELALCLRYYEKSFALDVAPAVNSAPTFISGLHCEFVFTGNIWRTKIPFLVRKRAAAAITIYNPQAANNMARARGVVDATSTASYGSESGFVIDAFFSTSPATPFEVWAHWAADAEL